MSMITFKGRLGCVKIGKVKLKAGDKVTDAKKPPKGILRTDSESLARLAARSDFEGKIDVPEAKKVEAKTDA